MAKFTKGTAVDLSALVKRQKPATPARDRVARHPRAAHPKPGGWKVRAAEWKRRSKLTLAMRVALAMRPGQWYARPDLLRILGGPYGSVKGRTASMVVDGLLERARVGEPMVFRKGEPVHEQQKRRQPEWLFRLTVEGVAFRARAEVLV